LHAPAPCADSCAGAGQHVVAENDEAARRVRAVQYWGEDLDDVAFERELGLELVARAQGQARELARVKSQAAEKHGDDGLEVHWAEISRLGIEMIQV
jgi:hypothetical protein